MPENKFKQYTLVAYDAKRNPLRCIDIKVKEYSDVQDYANVMLDDDDARLVTIEDVTNNPPVVILDPIASAVDAINEVIKDMAEFAMREPGCMGTGKFNILQFVKHQAKEKLRQQRKQHNKDGTPQP